MEGRRQGRVAQGIDEHNERLDDGESFSIESSLSLHLLLLRLSLVSYSSSLSLFSSLSLSAPAYFSDALSGPIDHAGTANFFRVRG